MSRPDLTIRPPGRPRKVLIVDDHPIVREGLAMRIASQPDLEVCGEAGDIPEAIRLVRSAEPDLAVIDISLKDGNGVDLIKRIKAKRPTVGLVAWSMHDENLYAERALRAGALAYVNKAEEPERLIEALRRAVEGKMYLSEAMTQRLIRGRISGIGGSPVESLSERELDVFRRLGQGKTIAEIAKELHISPKTAETYRDRIRAKLDVQGGPELMRTALLWVLENG